MTNTGKVLLLAAAGTGGYFLLTGTASAKRPGGRKPWRTKIPTVPNDIAWKTVDEAICQCFQAGARESVELVNCTLKRLWPNVPWPHRPGDHLSVLRVWQAVGNRVATFIQAEANGENPCAEIDEPDEPTPEEPDEPTPDEPIDIDDYFGDAPQRFVRITQNTNANPARTVERVYGLAPETANVGRALVCVANVGFNLLLYSRRRNPSYGTASVMTASGDRKHFDVGAAWNPWNNRVQTAWVTGEKLRRHVGWSGNGPAPGGDRAYGSPWMPPTTMTPQGILVCTNADPWAAENNPPSDVLAKLGWSLEEMRTAWLAGNP